MNEYLILVFACFVSYYIGAMGNKRVCQYLMKRNRELWDRNFKLKFSGQKAYHDGFSDGICQFDKFSNSQRVKFFNRFEYELESRILTKSLNHSELPNYTVNYHFEPCLKKWRENESKLNKTLKGEI